MRACLVESCVVYRSRSHIRFDPVLSVRCMCSDTRLCAASDIIIYLVSSECSYLLGNIAGVRAARLLCFGSVTADWGFVGTKKHELFGRVEGCTTFRMRGSFYRCIGASRGL